jgi:hypothetical protein
MSVSDFLIDEGLSDETGKKALVKLSPQKQL